MIIFFSILLTCYFMAKYWSLKKLRFFLPLLPPITLYLIVGNNIHDLNTTIEVISFFVLIYIIIYLMAWSVYMQIK